MGRLSALRKPNFSCSVPMLRARAAAFGQGMWAAAAGAPPPLQAAAAWAPRVARSRAVRVAARRTATCLAACSRCAGAAPSPSSSAASRARTPAPRRALAASARAARAGSTRGRQVRPAAGAGPTPCGGAAGAGGSDDAQPKQLPSSRGLERRASVWHRKISSPTRLAGPSRVPLAQALPRGAHADRTRRPTCRGGRLPSA
jgi:hypothetical protein